MKKGHVFRSASHHTSLWAVSLRPEHLLRCKWWFCGHPNQASRRAENAAEIIHLTTRNKSSKYDKIMFQKYSKNIKVRGLSDPKVRGLPAQKLGGWAVSKTDVFHIHIQRKRRSGAPHLGDRFPPEWETDFRQNGGQISAWNIYRFPLEYLQNIDPQYI